MREVLLPCEIGDTMYGVRNYKGKKHIQSGIVSEMYYTKDMRLQIVLKYVCRGEFGRVIFLNKEDAEWRLNL